MKPEELIQFLIENAIQWVQSQRDEHRSAARELTENEKCEFAPFFESSILDLASIKTVPVIQNPGFYLRLQNMNLPMLLDFTNAAGITFKDTILISQCYLKSQLRLMPLIFHELVHVVQYEVLGVSEFIERYVRGWAENGLDYYAIPLEENAHELQKRYEKDLERSFSVIEEVRRSVG